MRTYRVYGRRIASAVALPIDGERRDDGTGGRAVATGDTAEFDLVVRRDSLPETPEEIDETVAQVYESPSGTLRAYRHDRTVYWFADGVGTARVVDGVEVTASALPSASGDELGRLIAGPGFRTAFRLQGDLVVHASAVVVDGHAVAFTGRSGRGKSTTAAACYAAGYDVLADDAIPIALRDGTPVVPRGAPRLDVDGAARDALGLDGEGPVDATATATDGPHPLAAVYVLEDGDALDVVDLPPRRAAFALMRAADGLYEPDDAQAQSRHLEDAAAVVDAIDVGRLIRPRSLERLPALPAVVASDVSP